MDVVVWSDFLCPWCYIGLDRADHLRERHGLDVMWVPFDLHPEIPAEGLPTDVLRHHGAGTGLRAEAEASGLAFRRPERIPRTRTALEASEWVRVHATDRYDAYHRALFRAYWADGRDIGDRGEVLAIAAEQGVDRAALEAGLATGEPNAAVTRWTETGFELGASGTPAFLIGRLMVPGVQPKETLDRVVERLRERGMLDVAL